MSPEELAALEKLELRWTTFDATGAIDPNKHVGPLRWLLGLARRQHERILELEAEDIAPVIVEKDLQIAERDARLAVQAENIATLEKAKGFTPDRIFAKERDEFVPPPIPPRPERKDPVVKGTARFQFPGKPAADGDGT